MSAILFYREHFEKDRTIFKTRKISLQSLEISRNRISTIVLNLNHMTGTNGMEFQIIANVIPIC